jgi:hypothetical protein
MLNLSTFNAFTTARNTYTYGPQPDKPDVRAATSVGASAGLKSPTPKCCDGYKRWDNCPPQDDSERHTHDVEIAASQPHESCCSPGRQRLGGLRRRFDSIRVQVMIVRADDQLVRRVISLDLSLVRRIESIRTLLVSSANCAQSRQH